MIWELIDKLFRDGSRESQLLAGRIIIEEQAQVTQLWKLALMKARANGTEWPRIGATREELETILRDEPLSPARAGDTE